MKSLLLLLFSAGLSYGQTVRTIYFDSRGEVTRASRASFYCVITRQETDTTLYTTESFYASRTRKARGSYRAQTFPVSWEQLPASHFRDAFPEGTHQTYYENGQLQFEGDFLKGRGAGPHRRWYENGTLLSDMTLANGRSEGTSSSYHPNGQLKMQVSYRNGLPHGDLTEYDERGKKKSRVRMENGVPTGKMVRYDEQEQALPDAQP